MVISGSGNVAIYANQKATQLGAKVIAMSDSNGYIVDENGIDYKVIRSSRSRSGLASKPIWSMSPPPSMWKAAPASGVFPCDIALPCATQNEMDEASAKT